MRALGELLSFAYKEEERQQKEKLEKQLFPLWLANYAIAKIKNEGEIMGFEELVKKVLDENTPHTSAPKKEKKRTAEDIMAHFAPIVEADKKKGG